MMKGRIRLRTVHINLQILFGLISAHLVVFILMIFVLSGCTTDQVARLRAVGKEPTLQKIENPVEKTTIVVWPKAKAKAAIVSTANSLWGSGTIDFFKDGRARDVGDILRVKIEINDKAELDNKTERKRDSSNSLQAPSVFGLEKSLISALPGKGNPASLLSTSGAMDNSGEGIIEREEVIKTEVAAVVTQVLDNGNLVIYGSQEIRVNFEVRQLTVEGVIRPSDVSPSNTVNLNQIAEARVSYGGKGIITDVQQPRIGNQIADILSPW